MTTEPPELQDAPREVPLGELLPGLSAMRGEIPPHLVPTACRASLLNNAGTWEELAAHTISEVFRWRNVGPGRAGHVLRFAVRSAELPSATDTAAMRRGVATSKTDAALRLIAAWAVHHGMTGGITDALRAARRPGTPARVVAAADLLETIDLTTIALAQEDCSFDPRQAANELLGSFEGRDLAILERVLATGLRPVPTLEEIGVQFDITRERVRQLQVALEARLDGLLRSEAYDVLTARAEILAAEVGAACPVAHLPAELRPGASLTDELFSYLAGPFRMVDGWLLRRDIGDSPGQLARSAFDAVADENGVAASDALFDALSSLGVASRWHLALLHGADRIRLLDGFYVRWGTHVERLISMLAVAGRPMKTDELAAKAQSLDPDVAVRTLTNTLARDEFRRIGRGRYALAAWGGDDYRGIVDEMADALAGGPRRIDELTAELVDRFGMSPASVSWNAHAHPRFIAENAQVRLRGDHEPYEITDTLESTARCYQIDGAWAWRVPVDHDLLRGSGRAIPDAFAAALGASPTHPVFLKAGDQEIKIGWGMYAQIGSLRRRAEELELVEGDWMFVRHSSPAGLSFLPLPSWKLQAATPDERARLLVGASEEDERDLAACLADALGIAATQVELSDCVRVLEARGETDVLAAVTLGAAVDEVPGTSDTPDDSAVQLDQSQTAVSVERPDDPVDPVDPTIQPEVVDAPGAPTLRDGTVLSIGDWVKSRRGGDGDLGRVVAWPDQSDFPNWVRFEMPDGEQKVAHTLGAGDRGGLTLSAPPANTGLPTGDSRALPYEAMKLWDGSPARPGQVVRRRRGGLIGLITGLIPNSDNARVAVPRSVTGDWVQVKVNALELVEDV
jgi:hypothetical protein